MGILENKSNARVFYKYLSKVYDQVNRFTWTEEMRTEALSWLEFGDDPKVLDVGCGTGFGTEGLLQHTDDVHGLDQSIHQLEKAWAKFGKTDQVKFYRGDAERLPFADDSFDHYWSSGSIEYWPNPIDAIEEARRVTRPGGTVLIVGPDEPSNSLFHKIADAIMLFYDADEADRMFSEAGFPEREHVVMQANPGSPRAIVTIATVPEE